MALIDITDNVKVKLTTYGKNILIENERTKRIRNPALDYEFSLPKEDEEGWSIRALTVLMATFGNYLFADCDTPFNDRIQVETYTEFGDIIVHPNISETNKEGGTVTGSYEDSPKASPTEYNEFVDGGYFNSDQEETDLDHE